MGPIRNPRWEQKRTEGYVIVSSWRRTILFNPPFLWKCLYQVRAIAVFRLLTDFVCLLTYEFCLSLWKIARCSVILLLPLLSNIESNSLPGSGYSVLLSCTCCLLNNWCCYVSLIQQQINITLVLYVVFWRSFFVLFLLAIVLYMPFFD